MDRRYADIYRNLFETHWWWRAREDMILWYVRRLQLRGDPPNILDIGCGDGLFFAHLDHFGRVEGIENDDAIVSPTPERRGRIHVRPFDDSFDPGKRFSLITMLDVLEHFEDRVATLRRAARLLTPDGTLLLTVPAFMSLWTEHDEFNHHSIRYSKQTFREDAERAGVAIDEMRYFFVWPAVVKVLVRLWERFKRAEPEPAHVPPAPINAALYAACLMEHPVCRALPVPFGSSMIIRARRA